MTNRGLKIVLVGLIFSVGILLLSVVFKPADEIPVFKDKVHVLEYYEIQQKDNMIIYFLHVYDPEGREGTSFEYILIKSYTGTEINLLRTYRGKERFP